MTLEGNNTCPVCGEAFDSGTHEQDCYNSPLSDNGQSKRLSEFGPFEKWDVVAWRRTYHGEEGMTDFLDRVNRPHMNGQPVNVGYVRRVYPAHLQVEEATKSKAGDRVWRDSPIQLNSRMAEMELTTVRKEKVVGKKEREHNKVYQKKKRQREERQRRFQAKRDWKELPAWKRLLLWLTVRKRDWIYSRITELKENEE